MRTRQEIREGRNAFTIMELLIVVAMIALITSAIMFAMFGALEEARAARTRTQIAKLHEIIMERYSAFESRSLQMPAMASLSILPDPREVARVRVLAMRDLMRMEMPDRISDVRDPANPNNAALPTRLYMYYPNIYAANVNSVIVQLAQPSLHRNYYNRSTVNWSVANQGAECLYLIVSAIHEDGGDPIDYFTNSEIGDTDGDGMLEFLDGWGRPIGFLRWAPGFLSPMQDQNPDANPDPFDPLKTDIRWKADKSVADGQSPVGTYRLVPLIYSAGRDGIAQLFDQGVGFQYQTTPLLPSQQPPLHPYSPISANYYPNDPYYYDPSPPANQKNMIGEVLDVNLDDITNHLIEVK